MADDLIKQIEAAPDLQALDALRTACAGTENVMPYLLDAARSYATLGEIVDVMREVFGVYHEPVQI